MYNSIFDVLRILSVSLVVTYASVNYGVQRYDINADGSLKIRSFDSPHNDLVDDLTYSDNLNSFKQPEQQSDLCLSDTSSDYNQTVCGQKQEEQTNIISSKNHENSNSLPNKKQIAPKSPPKESLKQKFNNHQDIVRKTRRVIEDSTIGESDWLVESKPKGLLKKVNGGKKFSLELEHFTFPIVAIGLVFIAAFEKSWPIWTIFSITSRIIRRTKIFK